MDNWSTAAPTLPGWYFTKWPSGTVEIVLLELEPSEGVLWADDGGWAVDDTSNQWCGPIPKPGEPASTGEEDQT